MTKPDATHWKALDQIWQYLKRYPTRGLFLDRKNLDIFSKIYTDSDWASFVQNRRSTEVYITLIGKNPITWSTKLQKTIVCSSTEAEYMAISKATHEGLYMSNITG